MAFRLHIHARLYMSYLHMTLKKNTVNSNLDPIINKLDTVLELLGRFISTE